MASPAIPSATMTTPAAIPGAAAIDVLFMIGHDDDQVLDPSVRPPGCKRARVSQWTGKQSDVAIAEAVLSKFPRLRGGFARTVEDLLATEARVVVVLSYLTQASYAWYDKFFGALALGAILSRDGPLLKAPAAIFAVATPVALLASWAGAREGLFGGVFADRVTALCAGTLLHVCIHEIIGGNLRRPELRGPAKLAYVWGGFCAMTLLAVWV